MLSAQNYDQMEKLVGLQGNRFPTAKELVDYIKSKGSSAYLGGGEAWAPVRDTNGNKDYIQVGNPNSNALGASHKKDAGGWPEWADLLGKQWYCSIPVNKKYEIDGEGWEGLYGS